MTIDCSFLLPITFCYVTVIPIDVANVARCTRCALSFSLSLLPDPIDGRSRSFSLIFLLLSFSASLLVRLYPFLPLCCCCMHARVAHAPVVVLTAENRVLYHHHFVGFYIYMLYASFASIIHCSFSDETDYNETKRRRERISALAI